MTDATNWPSLDDTLDAVERQWTQGSGAASAVRITYRLLTARHEAGVAAAREAEIAAVKAHWNDLMRSGGERIEALRADLVALEPLARVGDALVGTGIYDLAGQDEAATLDRARAVLARLDTEGRT